jgi:hypothetical protein
LTNFIKDRSPSRQTSKTGILHRAAANRQRVYLNANLTPPPDAVLDQVVKADRGSARSIFSDLALAAGVRPSC